MDRTIQLNYARLDISRLQIVEILRLVIETFSITSSLTNRVCVHPFVEAFYI